MLAAGNFFAKAESAPTNGVLTNAAQIARLSRAEAERGLPVRLRGVVTCDAPEIYFGSVIHDGTRGVYCYWAETNVFSARPQRRPRLGELWEMEGVSRPGRFAPDVKVTNLTFLGEGSLPPPISPAWDQLLNGSLDTQLVEMEGIVTDADTNSILFLTHGGKIRITLTASVSAGLRAKKNSLVRLRGCLLASWDEATREVKLGEIRMANVTVTADAPESANPFDAPEKTVDDLLRFDVAASLFQRVKIGGQITGKRGEEFFMLNGRRGLRFIPREAASFGPGDVVEVSGLPELDGPSPVLREAVTRRTGFGPLPEPLVLKAEDIARPENDALRVRLEAVFNGWRGVAGETLLDLQDGGNFFSARIKSRTTTLEEIAPGSRVELTGVYVSLSAPHRLPGRHLGSLEILIASPEDVRVIARPPWWNLRRLLVLTGALAGILILAGLWITQLRRRVEERTEQLRHEISGRERAEQQRMVAEEKSRIARDLHDDLGASLTEIGLQADLARVKPPGTAQAVEQFGVIAEKTRAMVSALDVIVWAVDPEENTLPATAEYLGGYAEEFLAAAGLETRLKIPLDLPPVTVDGHTRHGIFLAVKEALNNAVRHAQAKTVEFGASFDGNILRIEIADDGKGFNATQGGDGHGVDNLHKRLENLGGKCQIDSQPGAGTKIYITLPLKK